MKKFFTMMVMAVFTVNIAAQDEIEEIIDSPYRIYMGVKGGASFSTMNGLPDALGLDPKMGVGFQEGAEKVPLIKMPLYRN